MDRGGTGRYDTMTQERSVRGSIQAQNIQMLCRAEKRVEERNRLGKSGKGKMEYEKSDSWLKVSPHVDQRRSLWSVQRGGIMARKSIKMEKYIRYQRLQSG